MKITIWEVIVCFLILYFIKRGVDEAQKDNKTVNVFEALMYGFQLTIDRVSKSDPENKSDIIDDDYGYYRPKNKEMVNFTADLNSFPNAKLYRKRGMFHIRTIRNGSLESPMPFYDCSAN